jgi:hypothetical protein
MIITGDDSQYITFVKGRLSEQFLISDKVHLYYFLKIEISVMASICPQKSTFRIFLIVLLSLTTVL